MIVVDSGSSDGSPQMVREKYPQAKLIEVANRGYPFAVNRGLEAATQPWLVQMNSDVYVEAGDLEALQLALQENPKAAFAGPILVNQEGKRQSFGLFNLSFGNPNKPKTVSWISGAIMVLGREAYQDLGGMDERIFFYNEEIEWCWRAKRKGWVSLLVPHKVIHLAGSSTPQDPRFIAEGYRGGLLLSQEYLPFWHGLHKKLVWLEATLRIRFDPDPVRSQGYKILLNLLEKGNLEVSPFLKDPT